MCGRYPTPRDADRLRRQFELQRLSSFEPQPNVAPTDPAPVIIATDDGRELRYMRWGLLPHWAKDEKQAARMINARVETVFEKPAYSRYVKRNRCIVPALGFFEWDQSKQPYLIRLKSGDLMGFAGIWNRWHDPVEPERTIETYSIITTDANSLVAEVHDRMPVLVQPGHYQAWLDKGVQDPESIAALTCQIGPDDVELVAQDRAINNARRKDVKVIE